MSELIGYALFFLMGIVLGMLGAGGSILTIPILVYVFAIPPWKATSYSLFIVGLSALTGTLRVHTVFSNKRVLLFALPSACAVFIARYFLTPRVPKQLGGLSRDSFLMMILSVIMLFAGVFMARQKPFTRPVQSHNDAPGKVVIIAVLFGLFMGFMGVGGGFLIVPVLVYLLGIPMKESIATSLVIIALNATVGFMADQYHLAWIDYKQLLLFSVLSVAGLTAGMSLQDRVNDAQLKRIFGWFVVMLAIGIGAKEMLFSS